jgi:hypothetical protein
LLQQYAIKGNNFFHGIVTGDESWSHHFDTETKQQSMKWHHTSPKKEEY